MKRILTRALWIVALATQMLSPVRAVASPPDLDVAELAAGEFGAEVNAFWGRDEWVLSPEIEFGLSDAFGLEVQAEFVDARSGAMALETISAQLMMAFSEDRSFGVAAEIGYRPDEQDTGVEVFLFASREAGPWTVDLNAGLEREEGATAGVYAWRIERELASDWSLGVEGGGEMALRGGEREHLLGPTLGATFGSLELRLGWFYGSGTDDLVRFGVERAF